MPSKKTVPLGTVADEITVGYVGPMASEYVDEGVPFLRSLNVNPYKFNPNEIKYISPGFHQKIQKSRLTPGDVAVVRTGNPGTACVIPDSLPDANCSDLVVIRCGDKLDPDFVSYYINSVTHSHVRNQAVGAIQKHFNIGSAKELPFPSINRSDQEGAVSILVKIDAKIDLNNRIKQELEGLAKLLYDYWFVQFDFPISAEQAAAMGDPTLEGKPYRQSGGKMVYNETLKREIPEGWEGAEVVDVLAKQAKTNKIPSSEILVKGDTPVVDQSSDFIRGFTNDPSAIITDLPKILFGDHTRVLKFVDFKFARGADGTQLITSNDTRLPPILFYHQLMDFDLSNYGYARHFKFLKEQKVFLPSEAISQRFENEAGIYFELLANHRAQNQHLAELRDWLLPMLMNGQVTVGEEPVVG